MPNTTALYVYVAQGTPFKPGSLVGDCAYRADYVTLDNGDAVGVLHAINAKARVLLGAQPGITVLPDRYETITAAHVTLYAYAGAAATDTTNSLALKLFAFHRMPWFHPEEQADSHSAISDLLA